MLITLSYALLYGDSLKITYTLIEEIKKLQKAPSNEARCTDATACARCYRKQEKGTLNLEVGKKKGTADMGRGGYESFKEHKNPKMRRKM